MFKISVFTGALHHTTVIAYLSAKYLEIQVQQCFECEHSLQMKISYI